VNGIRSPFTADTVNSDNHQLLIGVSKMKICLTCNTSKSISEFSKKASSGDGLQYSCKSCSKISSDLYYLKNFDKRKAYLSANRDREASYRAKYYAENREKSLLKSKLFFSENPELRRIYNQNRRAIKRSTGGIISKGLADILFNLQRGKCPGCKQPLGDDYQLDHIMPIHLGGANEDWNIQLLRKTCNQQKHAKHPIDFMQSRGFLI